MAELVIAATACRGAGRVPVSGELAGRHVVTSVDDRRARDLLTSYLNGRAKPPATDSALRSFLDSAEAEPLGPELLGGISRRFSPDFATIYLAHRLTTDPTNAPTQQRFLAYLRQFRALDPGRWGTMLRVPPSLVIAFVPGYAYRTDTTTGAALTRQRRLLARYGLETALVATDELAGVEHNARIVAEALENLSARYQHIVLVSASKGGPEVALALAELRGGKAVPRVRGWVSIGGLLRGTPYADRFRCGPRRLLARAVFAVQGLDPAVIPNLSEAVRRRAFDRLALPSGILYLSYIGAPLSGQVSRDVRGRYRALRARGPNDGLTLLADELIPGGRAVIDVGLDHYFRDPEIDLKTLALTAIILDHLAGGARALAGPVERDT